MLVIHVRITGPLGRLVATCVTYVSTGVTSVGRKSPVVVCDALLDEDDENEEEEEEEEEEGTTGGDGGGIGQGS